MATTYGSPTNLDLSSCTLTASGGTTSQTLADLGKTVSGNSSAIASVQSAVSTIQDTVTTANTTAGKAAADSASALTTAQAAQSAVGTPVQTSSAGKMGGYVAYDTSNGNARIECITPATSWVPICATLEMNPGADAANSSYSSFSVVSSMSGTVVNGVINMMSDSNGKINYSFSNTWGHIGPDTDGGMDLATNGQAFNNCYLKTAPSVTSDENEKTVIGSLADVSYEDGQKLLQASDAVSAKVFQLNSSIAEKGAANARLHIGYIAQEWETALSAVGLDPNKLGLLVTFPMTTQVVRTAKDANGKTITFTETVPVYEEDGKTQKNGYMLRYDELQCLLLEARKQKQIALESRIAALEAKASASTTTGTAS